MKRLFTLYAILLCTTFAVAQQRFFNLTKDEVQIEYTVPHVGWHIDLPENYQDSVYTVSMLYPEFIDMAPSDVEKYHEVSDEPLPEMPAVNYCIGYNLKKPQLLMDVCPFAYRNGKYQILVGFMLKVDVKAVENTADSKRVHKAKTPAERYAEHSVLASGTWVKIRVPETGVYQLTEALVKQAGFTDINKVKVYGYGGNLQNEKFVADDLVKFDDLKEVEQCIVDGKHLFYAKGPVSWDSKSDTTRTRNPYSSYGYYFLTQNDEPQTTVDETEFFGSFYPSFNDYHSLYENDNFAWFSGGRNLFDAETINAGSSKTITLKNTTGSTNGTLYINISSATTASVKVEVNGEFFCNLSITVDPKTVSYDVAKLASKTAAVKNLTEENNIKVTVSSGGPVHLDYVALTYPSAAAKPDLKAKSFPVPEYVHRITNQDHHADPQADMVIIIPTSQKLLSQATRLKNFHEENDGMRVTIVPADELYNEFSSGTPDANAYRRYMKMLYDRAETKEDMPKHLLLFGDCVWDNRMLTSSTRTLSPDDYLLCFESDNSLNHVKSYVDDGWFCLLDDGEGADPLTKDLLDIGVGRFPVTTDAQAKVMVDKTINYVNNQNVGPWQNTIMLMGDDGNDNIHMDDADAVAKQTAKSYPGYLLKKVMWDVYNRVTSATGNTYPEVSRIIKQQQNAGALIMNYAGHGSEVQISHEAVLNIKDFADFNNTNLPLWITASCDIMPFDSGNETIGETAVLNPKGGAVAFYGTTRTVYQNYNKLINLAFMNYLLGKDDNGEYVTLGEAQRLAKNYLLTSGKDREENKLQFSLLGDPAMKLNLPKLTVVLDEVNGVSVNGSELPVIKAGSIATFKGHVETDEPFNGVVNITVNDTEEHIVCRLNNVSSDGADTAFEYDDRTKVLFSGSDDVKDGQFSITFAVPKDINYADAQGMVTMYAYNNEKTLSAHGCSDKFIVGGTENLGSDGKGPSIYCYLNSPSFVNGGDVNATPYFVAQINDADGLNTSGNGIGHDLQLVIDGKMTMTYNLNNNFDYDFGSYTSGSTFYSIPELPAGKHTLQFRAWDVFNNSSTATLDFNVVKSLEPQILSVSCTANPATTNTTFIVSHDRVGTNVILSLDIMDMSGRILWNHKENSLSSTGSSTIDWDLTVDDGHSLQTGVYLYRVNISCEGSNYASKAKKLIIVK